MRRVPGRILPAAALVLGAALLLALPAAAKNEGWSPTGSMSKGRAFHTATRLRDGRVLVAGGFGVGAGPPFTAAAELYNPHTGTWTATAPMHVPRAAHMAVLLKDGRVLVAGGEAFGSLTPTAELYDPKTATWTLTGSMHVAREESAMRLLDHGKVLVAGGDTSPGPTAAPTDTAELYDPRSGTWTLTTPLHVARTDVERMAIALRGGSGGGEDAESEPQGAKKVLVPGGCVTGGQPTNTAEIYDAKTATWKLTTPMPVPLCDSAGVLLDHHTVLEAGGESPAGVQVNTALLYDVKRNVWTLTTPMNSRRSEHTLSPLGHGTALAVGGFTAFDTPTSTSEIYDAKHRTWTLAGSMSVPRSGHTATPLKGHTLLVAGGLTAPPVATPTADLYGKTKK